MEEPRLETQVRQREDVLIVDVRGEVDMETAPRLKEALSAATRDGNHVVVNMADVSYMDSTGFGMLLGATKRLRPSGGSLHLVGCNDVISRMLQITRLNTIFHLHPSEDAALHSIVSNGDAFRADGPAAPVH